MGASFKYDDDTEDAPPLVSEESSYADIRKTIIDLSDLRAADAFTAGVLVGAILGAVTVVIIGFIRRA
jgi:hypothetical protein